MRNVTTLPVLMTQLAVIFAKRRAKSLAMNTCLQRNNRCKSKVEPMCAGRENSTIAQPPLPKNIIIEACEQKKAV